MEVSIYMRHLGVFNYLGYNIGTMFSHSIHDGKRSILTRGTGRFGRYCQRINESLWMMLPNICEEIVDVTSNVGMRCLDPRDDLLTCKGSITIWS